MEDRTKKGLQKPANASARTPGPKAIPAFSVSTKPAESREPRIGSFNRDRSHEDLAAAQRGTQGQGMSRSTASNISSQPSKTVRHVAPIATLADSFSTPVQCNTQKLHDALPFRGSQGFNQGHAFPNLGWVLRMQPMADSPAYVRPIPEPQKGQAPQLPVGVNDSMQTHSTQQPNAKPFRHGPPATYASPGLEADSTADPRLHLGTHSLSSGSDATARPKKMTKYQPEDLEFLMNPPMWLYLPMPLPNAKGLYKSMIKVIVSENNGKPEEFMLYKTLACFHSKFFTEQCQMANPAEEIKLTYAPKVFGYAVQWMVNQGEVHLDLPAKADFYRPLLSLYVLAGQLSMPTLQNWCIIRLCKLSAMARMVMDIVCVRFVYEQTKAGSLLRMFAVQQWAWHEKLLGSNKKLKELKEAETGFLKEFAVDLADKQTERVSLGCKGDGAVNPFRIPGHFMELPNRSFANDARSTSAQPFVSPPTQEAGHTANNPVDLD